MPFQLEDLDEATRRRIVELNPELEADMFPPMPTFDTTPLEPLVIVRTPVEPLNPFYEKFVETSMERMKEVHEYNLRELELVKQRNAFLRKQIENTQMEHPEIFKERSSWPTILLVMLFVIVILLVL